MRSIVLAAVTSSVVSTIWGGGAHADDASSIEDRVFVTAGRLGGARAGPTQYAIDYEAVVASRASSLDGLLRNAPAAAVQVNSRGESLVYLRGAGERQTAVYFAGAPINVPWDNRLNLAIVPARAVASVHITSGPASVLFSSDAAGGVIEISPIGALDGPIAFADAEFGEGGIAKGGALAAARVGGVDITLGGGHETREGEPISSDAALPFFQGSRTLRTNTDFSRTTGYARARIDLGANLEAAATLLAFDASFGVAPEGYEDPATGNPRFWRYPEHRTMIGVLNGRYAPGKEIEATAALWFQHFEQQIDSFATAAFTDLEDSQLDRDQSFGVRVAARRTFPSAEIRGSFSVSDARHRQIDQSFAANLLTDEESATFRRRTFSVGAEYERYIGDFTIMIGAGGDFFQSLDVGGRGDRQGFAGWSGTAAVDYRVDDRFSLSAAIARKPRPATQRELYGEAVGRFLLNPDLRPEAPIRFEAAANFVGDRTRLSVIPFAVLTSNTIDQQTVVVDGVSRRQRINLEGSSAFGVDIVGETDITDRLILSANLSALRLRSRDDRTASGDRFIPERPALLATFAAAYRHPSGLGLRLEANGRGRAYSLDGEGFSPLPQSLAFNAEASYSFALSGKLEVETYLRADNLGDSLVEPQLGLPAPGRWIRGGLRLALPGSGT